MKNEGREQPPKKAKNEGQEQLSPKKAKPKKPTPLEEQVRDRP